MSCTCTTRHSPRLTAQSVEVHHVVPRSWSGPDIAANRTTLCPTAHTLVHELLNLYVHSAGAPPASALRAFPRLVQQLAARGWAGRPSDHPPFTLTHTHDS